MLLAALQYKKNSHDHNEGKSAFQTTAIELHKKPKKLNEKRTPKIINKLYKGRCNFKCTRIIDYCLDSVFLKIL